MELAWVACPRLVPGNGSTSPKLHGWREGEGSHQRKIRMVSPECVKGWVLGSETHRVLAGLKHRARILSFPASIWHSFFLPIALSSNLPSLWPLAKRHCCSSLGRGIDCLSEPFRALILTLHFTWCVGASWTPASTLTLLPLPIPLCFLATAFLFCFLQEVCWLSPDHTWDFILSSSSLEIIP